MLSKRANAIQQGLALADATLTAHAERLDALQTCHAALLEQLENEKLDIVGKQLPLGDVLQNVIREAQAALSPWWRRVSVAVNWPLKILRGIPAVIRKLKELFSKKENVQPFRRDAIEREALRHHTEHLADRWRADYQHILDLSAASCVAALRDFETEQIPEPDAEWHEFAAQRSRKWVHDHPTKAKALLTLDGVVGLMAPVAFTVDLFTTGGLVTIKVSAWNLIGGAGAGALAIGALLHKVIEIFGMQRLVQGFQEEWKKQRNRQLRAHLREYFARPLVLDGLQQRIKALTNAPASECTRTVTELRRLLSENPLSSIS